jgi:hypothetical protein
MTSNAKEVERRVGVVRHLTSHSTLKGTTGGWGTAHPPIVPQRLEGAVAGARLVDAPRCSGLKELDNSQHQSLARFVTDDVNVAA